MRGELATKFVDPGASAELQITAKIVFVVIEKRDPGHTRIEPRGPFHDDLQVIALRLHADRAMIENTYNSRLDRFDVTSIRQIT